MNLEYVRAVFPDGSQAHWTTNEKTTIVLNGTLNRVTITESTGDVNELNLNTIPLVTYKQLVT